MQQPGIWGGDLELMALSKILKKVFKIYISDGNILTVSIIFI
jgi:hypothetical protein